MLYRPPCRCPDAPSQRPAPAPGPSHCAKHLPAWGHQNLVTIFVATLRAQRSTAGLRCMDWHWKLHSLHFMHAVYAPMRPCAPCTHLQSQSGVQGSAADRGLPRPLCPHAIVLAVSSMPLFPAIEVHAQVIHAACDSLHVAQHSGPAKHVCDGL